MQLPLTVNAWPEKTFDSVFKQELCTHHIDKLPLQQGLQHSSVAIADKLSLTVLAKQLDNSCLTIKAGLFYAGIISGCSCADDPTPLDVINEYCEILVEINIDTAEATITLLEY